MRRVAVMGSGSWGTAFGMVLADAGGEVGMWAREPEVVEDINENHLNTMYHPGIELPLSMWASETDWISMPADRAAKAWIAMSSRW